MLSSFIQLNMRFIICTFCFYLHFTHYPIFYFWKQGSKILINEEHCLNFYHLSQIKNTNRYKIQNLAFSAIKRLVNSFQLDILLFLIIFMNRYGNRYPLLKKKFVSVPSIPPNRLEAWIRLIVMSEIKGVVIQTVLPVSSHHTSKFWSSKWFIKLPCFSSSVSHCTVSNLFLLCSSFILLWNKNWKLH